MNLKLNDEIETLSQRIGTLTSALAANSNHDIKYWFDIKAGIVTETIRINHELDKILIGKLK